MLAGSLCTAPSPICEPNGLTKDHFPLYGSAQVKKPKHEGRDGFCDDFVSRDPPRDLYRHRDGRGELCEIAGRAQPRAMPALRPGARLDQAERLAVHQAAEAGRLSLAHGAHPVPHGRPDSPPERPDWNLAARSEFVQRQSMFPSLILANGTAPVHVSSTRPGLSCARACSVATQTAAPRGRVRLWVASWCSHERDIEQRRPAQPGHSGQDRREAGVALPPCVAAGYSAAVVRPVAAAGNNRNPPTGAPLPAVADAGSIAAARRRPLLKSDPARSAASDGGAKRGHAVGACKQMRAGAPHHCPPWKPPSSQISRMMGMGMPMIHSSIARPMSDLLESVAAPQL